MHVYTIEGDAIESMDDFWREIGRAINGPGGYFGRNFDALNDCLRGGFGTPDEPFEIRWANSARSKEALSWEETVRYLERRLKGAHPSNHERIRREIASARDGTGPTLFDMVVEMIEQSRNANLVLE